ncbi:hypothetical protein H8356DRAFT_849177, partial [Neocallimastix lanati (nom. inval.)]
MSANLVKASDNRQNEEDIENPKSSEIIKSDGKVIKTTNGLTVASLTRMKDFDGTYGAFFIFHDMSVCVEGTYRLKFSLYEISGNGKKLSFRRSILSDNFKVLSAREFPGMQESSPLVKLFAEQGLKIRIRKDKSLSKHPSKRIFVDLPGYDYEKKKTTYIYVGKYQKSIKENERNSSNDNVFENEIEKSINHNNHNDYIKDQNIQNSNSNDNMYNKYISSKQDNYYNDYDYERDIRRPMGDEFYHDMKRNKISSSMMENRNKMNMRNYINNEDINLNQYNSNNYRIMSSNGNRNRMNDSDINISNNNNMSPPYYENSSYPFYLEDNIKLKDSNRYMNEPQFQNKNYHRNDYNPSLNNKPNNYDKPNDYPNMIPIRPMNNYPEPPFDPSYMNDYNIANKKVYEGRRNSIILNQNNGPKENESMNGSSTIHMDRNDYYQRIPMRNSRNNDDYERFRNVKMEDDRRRMSSMSNPMFDRRLEGNVPSSLGYSDDGGAINNEYSRKRKYNSIENNYVLPNDNYYDDIKRNPYGPNPPRKSSFDSGMNHHLPPPPPPPRDNNSDDDFMNRNKSFYGAKEEESKVFIQKYQYYKEKRGNINEYNGRRENERFERINYYDYDYDYNYNYNYSYKMKNINENNMYNRDNLEFNRQETTNYNINMMPNRKNSNPNIYMNNEFM